MASPRNKTITLSAAEEAAFVARCITPSSPLTVEEATDTVLLGDTFSLLSLLPSAGVDLLIVDPPYNLTKDFGGSQFKKQNEEEYRAFTLRWLDLVTPLLKPNASVYVCCDWQSSVIIGPLLSERFTVRNRITWQREKGRGAVKNWKNSMEDIWFATVSDEYTFHVDAVKQRRMVLAPYRENGVPKDWEETENGRFRDTCPSNFWDDITVPYWSMGENTEHPTQKPEKLLAKLILASSSEGDLVLDPFLGVGSTAVTARKLGRRFVGIEQNPRYCALTQKRLEMAVREPAIQGYTDGVFWARNTHTAQTKKK